MNRVVLSLSFLTLSPAMVKTQTKANQAQAVAPQACLICDKTYQSVQQLCGFCIKKLKVLKDAQEGSFERELFTLVFQVRVRDRKSFGKRLVTQKKCANPDQAAQIDRLRKRNKVLYVTLRRLRSRHRRQALVTSKKRTLVVAPKCASNLATEQPPIESQPQ